MRHRVRIGTLTVLVLCIAPGARAQAKQEIPGRWDGTSICTKIPGSESCHDEMVVDRPQAAAVAPQAPAVAPQPTVELPPELARVLTDYEAAWQARDAAALARLFADDRVVVPNACAPVRGRDAVQRCYAGSGGPLSLRAIAHAVDGTLGYIIGAYTTKKGDPDGGKFTLSLAKDATGRWLIVADMDRPYPRAR